MTQRRSQRKKASPAIVISDDDEEFVPVAANDKCVASLLLFLVSWLAMFSHFIILYSLSDDEKTLDDHQHLDTDDDDKDTSKKKDKKKPAGKYGPFVPFIRKKSGPSKDVQPEDDDDDEM